MEHTLTTDAGGKTRLKRLFCIVDPNLKDFVGHHLEYDAATAGAAARLGYEVACLGHVDADPAIEQQLPLRRTFQRDMWWRPQGAPLDAAIAEANRSFETDLRAGLAAVEVRSDSIVFGHMITANQVLGWARLIESLPKERRPHFVLLLRYQPALYSGAAAEEGFRRLRQLVAHKASVRFCSDSEPLADELQRLTGLKFEVMPLPHTSHTAPTTPPRPWPRPLRVVSLGNAREEKGILEIFEAALLLDGRGEGARFEFALQVNDPEPELKPAIEQIARTGPSNVTLYRTALSSVEYAALLHSADVVLVPYRREIYAARTSGVLVEAIAAGKPVVCTDGTWLSQQLAAGGSGEAIADGSAGCLAGALLSIADRWESYAAAADAKRRPYLARHNPEALVEAVAHGGSPIGDSGGARAALFYPWGDAHRRSSGASLRVNLLSEFLLQRGVEVRLLQDSEEPARRLGGALFDSYPLLHRAERSRSGERLRRLFASLAAKPGEEIYTLLHLYPGMDREFQSRIDELVRWSDVVFMEYGFWAGPVSRACKRYGRTLILTAHDIVSHQVQSPVLRWITRALERRAMKRADRVGVLAPGDFETFKSWGLPVTLTPSAVDAERVRQAKGRQTRLLLNRLIGLPDADDAPILLFVGTRFGPNIVAAEHIRTMADAYAETYPGSPVRFVLAGSAAAPAQEGVYVALGMVPEVTLRLLYANCTCVLVPIMEGTGASTKAFEALAAGAPVVATALGLRGVEAENRGGCVVEEDLSAWPALLHDLIGDRTRLRELRALATEAGGRFTPETRFEPYLAFSPVLTETRPSRGLTDNARRLELDTARAALDHGLQALAIEIAEEVRDKAPEDAEAAVLQASALAEGGPEEMVHAYRLLDRAILDGADAVAVYRARARLLERDLQPILAAQALGLAARIAVNRAASGREELNVRMEVWRLFHAGEKLWANAVAREAVAAFGDRVHFDYSYLLALTESERPDGDLPFALANVERALEHGGDPFWTNCLIADLRRRTGRPLEEIARAFRAALAAAPPDEARGIASEGVCWAAWRFFELGDPHLALEQVDRAVEADPDLPNARYLRAECLQHIGAPAEAVAAEFEKARACGYDPIWCDLHIARLLGPVPEQSITNPSVRLAAERVLERRPSSELLARVRDAAWQAFSERNYDGALSFADVGIANWPDDGALHYLMAECLQVQNRELIRALHAYDRALGAGFDPYWVLFNRAQLHRKLGRSDQARHDLESALDVTRDPARRSAALTSLEQLRQDELPRPPQA